MELTRKQQGQVAAEQPKAARTKRWTKGRILRYALLLTLVVVALRPMDTGVAGVGEIPRWKLWRGYVLNFMDMGGGCRSDWLKATAGAAVFGWPSAVFAATYYSITEGTPWIETYCTPGGEFNVCEALHRPNFGGCPALLPYPSDMGDAGYLP